MSSSRDSFLQRVRETVQAGNRAGAAVAMEARGSVGYQGAGPDAVSRLRDEFSAAGGQPYLVRDDLEAAAKVLELVHAKSARKVLLGQGAVLQRLDLLLELRIQLFTVNPRNK